MAKIHKLTIPDFFQVVIKNAFSYGSHNKQCSRYPEIYLRLSSGCIKSKILQIYLSHAGLEMAPTKAAKDIVVVFYKEMIKFRYVYKYFMPDHDIFFARILNSIV